MDGAPAAQAAPAGPVQITGDSAVFPARFDGLTDGVEWLGEFELFCRYKSIIKDDNTIHCEPQIRALLAVLLSGGAKLWYDSIPPADRDTWAKLRALFVTRFAEMKFLKYKHSREMFTSKQEPKEPVLQYIARIQKLARKSRDQPDANMIIHAVMAGVKGHIAGYLAEKSPATLEDLIKHASVAESTLGETEHVSAAQLTELQADMKRQFELLALKLTGSSANVITEEPRAERAAHVTFDTRSPSGDRDTTRRRSLNREPRRAPRSPSPAPTPNRYDRTSRERPNYTRPAQRYSQPRETVTRGPPHFPQRRPAYQQDQRQRMTTPPYNQDNRSVICQACALHHTQNDRCFALGKTCFACGLQNHFANSHLCTAAGATSGSGYNYQQRGMNNRSDANSRWQQPRQQY